MGQQTVQAAALAADCNDVKVRVAARCPARRAWEAARRGAKKLLSSKPPSKGKRRAGVGVLSAKEEPSNGNTTEPCFRMA